MPRRPLDRKGRVKGPVPSLLAAAGDRGVVAHREGLPVRPPVGQHIAVEPRGVHESLVRGPISGPGDVAHRGSVGQERASHVGAERGEPGSRADAPAPQGRVHGEVARVEWDPARRDKGGEDGLCRAAREARAIARVVEGSARLDQASRGHVDVVGAPGCDGKGAGVEAFCRIHGGLIGVQILAQRQQGNLALASPAPERLGLALLGQAGLEIQVALRHQGHGLEQARLDQVSETVGAGPGLIHPLGDGKEPGDKGRQHALVQQGLLGQPGKGRGAVGQGRVSRLHDSVCGGRLCLGGVPAANPEPRSPPPEEIVPGDRVVAPDPVQPVVVLVRVHCARVVPERQGRAWPRGVPQGLDKINRRGGLGAERRAEIPQSGAGYGGRLAGDPVPRPPAEAAMDRKGVGPVGGQAGPARRVHEQGSVGGVGGDFDRSERDIGAIGGGMGPAHPGIRRDVRDIVVPEQRAGGVGGVDSGLHQALDPCCAWPWIGRQPLGSPLCSGCALHGDGEEDLRKKPVALVPQGCREHGRVDLCAVVLYNRLVCPVQGLLGGNGRRGRAGPVVSCQRGVVEILGPHLLGFKGEAVEALHLVG